MPRGYIGRYILIVSISSLSEGVRYYDLFMREALEVISQSYAVGFVIPKAVPCAKLSYS